MSSPVTVNVYSLDSWIEFDAPFRITPNGNGTAIIESAQAIAPDSIDGELTDDRWSYFTHGYSGQYGYDGPIMHPSEFVGGRLAHDIIAEAGIYCLVTDYDDDGENDDRQPNGWAVIRLDED